MKPVEEMTSAEIQEELKKTEDRLFGTTVIMASVYNALAEERAGLPYSTATDDDVFRETRALFNDLSDRKSVLEEALSAMA